VGIYDNEEDEGDGRHSYIPKKNQNRRVLKKTKYWRVVHIAV